MIEEIFNVKDKVVLVTGGSKGIGWPTGSEAEITDLNIYNLGIILGPVVAVFGLIGGFIYSKYDLTREKHEQIRSQLKEKRG